MPILFSHWRRDLVSPVNKLMLTCIDLSGPNNSPSSAHQFHDGIERHIHNPISRMYNLSQIEVRSSVIVHSCLPWALAMFCFISPGIFPSCHNESSVLQTLTQSPMLCYLPQLPFIPVVANLHIRAKRKIQCPFCKGSHTTSLCKKKSPILANVLVLYAKKRFNCLEHHKISACNSKYTTTEESTIPACVPTANWLHYASTIWGS